MRYIRQFTRKQERNQTKTLEQQKHDLDLARKVLTAVTAFSFIGNPFVAMASTITRVDDGTTVTDGHVNHIYAGNIVNNTAVNRFDQFKIDAGDIANMYFQTSQNQKWADNLVNFVNNRIDVAGTVNAIKENKIGGNLFFLSSQGMAVTNSGVINAGSLYVMTPTEDFMKKILGEDDLSGFNEQWDNISKMEIPVNPSGTITVLGTINAANDVKMTAAQIGIGENVSGDSSYNVSPEDAKKAVIKTNVTDFRDIVNIKSENNFIDAGLDNTKLNADVDPNSGDIVLRAVASTVNSLDKNFDKYEGSNNQAKASVTVDGTINARKDAVITAEATNGVKLADLFNNESVIEGDDNFIEAYGQITKNVATVDINGNVTGQHVNIEANTINNYISSTDENVKLGILTGLAGVVAVNWDASYAVLANEAAVNVNKGAVITAKAAAEKEKNALNISADSSLKASVGASTSAIKLANLKGTSNVPAASVGYAKTDNKAAVNIAGELHSKGHTNISAKADSTVELVSADTTTQLDGQATVFNVAVAIADGSNSSSVDIKNTAEMTDLNGDLDITATSTNSIDTQALVKGKESSFVGTAVNITDFDSSADVKIDTAIEADSVDIAAGNSVVKNNVSANNNVGSSYLMNLLVSRATKTKTVEDIKAFAGQVKTKILGESKPDIVTALNQLGEWASVGVSVGVVNETNNANVTLTKNAQITAQDETRKQGDISVTANNYIADTSMSVTGATNNHSSDVSNEALVNAAVLYSDMDSNATVTLEGGTAHDDENAVYTQLNGANINVQAKSEFNYGRITKMIGDILSLCVKLKNAYAPNETYQQHVNELEAKAKEFSAKCAADPNYANSVEGNEAAIALANAANTVSIDAADGSVDEQIKDIFAGPLSVAGAAAQFANPNNYANFQAGASTSGKSEDGASVAVSGAVNLNYITNNANVIVGKNTKITGSGKVDVNASAAQEDVAFNGKLGLTGGADNAAGGTVGVHFGEVNSTVAIAEGAEVTGSAINIGADNDVAHTAITFGAGKSGNAFVGMGSYLEGDSNSIVSIDDEASLTATGRDQYNPESQNENNSTSDTITGSSDGSVNITAHNNTVLTNIAGGGAIGGENAGIGASVAITDYDVYNMAGIVNNDAGVSANTGEVPENETEDQKRERVQNENIAKLQELTKTQSGLTDDEYANLFGSAENTIENAGINAHDVNANVLTDGTINTVTIAGSAVTGSDYDKPGIGDKFDNFKKNMENRVENGITKIDTAVQNKYNSTMKSPNLKPTNMEASNPNAGQKRPSFTISGAGSSSVNLIDGASTALLDGAKITLVGDNAGNAGKLNVSAADSSFIGAWSGAAAISWKTFMTDQNWSNKSVGFAGTVGVNMVNTDVASIIRNSTINNAGSITNTADKSGALVAAGLGMAVEKGGAGGGNNYGGAASVSVNIAENDIYAVMQANTVNAAENTEKTVLTNTAYDNDVQVTGGINASIALGGQQGVSVGGTVTYAELTNTVQSAIAGGTYNNMGTVDVNAVTDITQVGAAVGVAAATGSENNYGIDGVAAYNQLNNNADAVIDGADITADKVNAAAYDTDLGENKHTEYINDRGLDATGNTYLQNVSDTAEDLYEKDDKGKIKLDENGQPILKVGQTGNTIVTGALGITATTGSGGGSGSAAISISDINNDFNASIKNSNIKTNGLAADGADDVADVNVLAKSDTLLANIAAGGAGASKGFAGAGSFGWSTVNNDNTASIENSTIDAATTKVNAISGTLGVNVAGQVTVGKQALGLAVAYNDLENNTGAYILGSDIKNTDTNDEGNEVIEETDVTVAAENSGKMYAVGAGVGVSTDTAAANGTIAINRGNNNLEAVVGDYGSGEDTRHTKITNAKNIDVTSNDNASVLSVAGGVGVSKKVTVGGSVAYNEIGNISGNADGKIQNNTAQINNAVITTANGATIDVQALDNADLTTAAVGVGVAAGGNVSVQGAAATALINKDTEASMNGVTISKASEQDSSGADVTVKASSSNDIITTADTVSATVGSAGAAVGAGVAVNRSEANVNALVSGGTMNVDDLAVRAANSANITTVGVGGSVAGGTGAGVTGSVAVNMIGNGTTAKIDGGSDITASNNVIVAASGDESIANYAGSASVAVTGAAVGLSVSVNEIASETHASIEGDETKVSAEGNGDTEKVKDSVEDDQILDNFVDEDAFNSAASLADTRKDSEYSGVAVSASSTHTIKSFLVNGGVAGKGAAVNGTVNVNSIGGSTSAAIRGADINANAASDGNVHVVAHDYANSAGIVGTANGTLAGAAVGLGSDTNTVSRDVSAEVLGKGTADSNGRYALKNTVNADKLSVDAEAKQGISSLTTGISAAAVGAGVSNATSVALLEGKTTAQINGTAVSAASLDVTSDHTAKMNTLGVAVGASEVGVGIGVSVLNENSETAAKVTDADINMSKEDSQVTIKANNHTKVNYQLYNGGGGLVGVAGSIGVSNVNSKVNTTVEDTSIGQQAANTEEIEGAAKNIQISAENDIDFTNNSGTVGGGAVGVGVGVAVNTIDSQVQTRVDRAELHASGAIDVSANETRKVNQLAVNAQAGSVTGGANIMITNVGKTVDSVYGSNLQTNADGEVQGDGGVNTDKIYTEANDAITENQFQSSYTLGAVSKDDSSAFDSATAGKGSEKSIVQVAVDSSTLDTKGKVALTTEETTEVKMNGINASASVNGSVSGTVGILGVHRNSSVEVTSSSIHASELDAKANVNGKSDLNIYQGTVGGVASIGAAYGSISTDGKAGVGIKDSSIESTGEVNLSAEDTSQADVDAIGVALAGGGAASVIVAEGTNRGETTVTVNHTDITAGNTISVNAKREAEGDSLHVRAIAGSGGLIFAGAGVSAIANEMGTVGTEVIGGSHFTAGDTIGLYAKNAPSVTAETGAVSGSMFASAAITVAEANVGSPDEDDHLKTSVKVDDSNTFTANQVTANAEADIKQKVDMNALSISVSPFPSGAVQVNTGGTEAYSDVTVNIGASVFQGKDSNTVGLNVSGSNLVTQTTASRGISASTGIATGTNLASTAAYLSTQVTATGSEASQLGNVDIKGSSSATIDNDANGYGGAFIDISPYAAMVENNYTADTDVMLRGTWKTTGSFTAQALNGMDVDLKSDAVRAAIVGGSGTWLNNIINNSANVTLDNANITTEGAQQYLAQNQVDYVGEIAGSGYGGININATDYKDDLDFTAGVDMKNSTLTGAGDEGSITAFASTEGTIHSKNSLKSAGVIPVALAFSDHDITYNNSVNVTNATLTTDKKDQDITLAATDDTDVKLETIADTQGGAVGAASAEASNTFDRSNKITVDKDSKLHSTNDVNLYAGANTEGISSSLDLQVLADAYNKTVIPLATAPKVDNAMTQANQVSVGGTVESVRHINASAAKGATTVTESAQEYNLYQGTSGSSTVASTTLGETVPHENGDANFVEIAEGASLTAGIHNHLNLTIEGEIPKPDAMPADGGSVDTSNITISVGEGEGWFRTDTVQTGTTTIKNNLMDRYNEVVRLMGQYEEGTSEYASYKSERDSLLLEMKRMGMAKEDINGNLTPSSEIEVPAVSLPDIVVSGGNINIDSDSLKGGGNLTAQGAPQINITNESDAYLVVNDVTIQDAGGQIRMNGSTLTADTAGNEMSAAQIHADGVTGGESQINISGMASMKEGMQADIGVFGDITNTSGDVTLTNNSYNLNILGNISGRNVSLVATNGSVTQTSAEGFINIGGDPVTKYQFSEDVANAIQEYIYDQFVANNNYKIPPFESYEEYVNWIKTNIVASGKYGITEADLVWKEDDPADPGNKIVAGGNVYINGLNVNIGGLVQSGYGKYSVTLDSSAQAKVDALDKEWQGKQEALSDSAVMANEKYLINAGGQVYNQETGVYDYEIRVYYNPSTGELLTDSVSVSGGKIYITGNISSTGGGKIMAMDGAADIAIDTSKIDKNVTVNTITNNDISGLISITDKNKTDGNGHYLVTEYRNGEQRSYYSGGVLSDWSAVTGDMGYDPEKGLQYQWTGGVSGEVTTKYQYTEDFLFWGLLDYGESDTFVAGLKAENKMPEGTPVSSGGTAGKENGVVITKGNGGKDFSITGSYSNSSDETYSDISPDMKYDGFWGKVFGYGTTTYTWTGKKGTASSTTTSVAADNHIQIGFIGNGNGSGNISVTSGGDMTLAGNISNASVVDENSQIVGKGSVSLTSQNGAITGNGIINSDDVNLKAAGDINVNHAAIGSGAAVNIASDNGDIHFTSSKGDLAIEQVVTGGTDPITAETGSVYIEAAGSILDAHTSGDYAVKGQRIDLISKMGSIGTKNNALTILGGSELYSSDTMASSVNASAKGDIVLTQVDGNMRLGTIASTDGDAVLTVTNGSFVDAHPSENSSSSSAQDKIDRWLESGLINSEDEAGESKEAAAAARDERVGALEERMNSLAAEGTHSVDDYKAAAEKLHNASESLQDAKNTYSQGYQEAYAAHSAAIEQAGGDAAAIEAADAAYKQAVEDLTSTYLDAQAEIYGDGFSVEEQQLINSYAETAYSENYGWSKNQLLYAIQDTVLNTKPGEVQTVETPNVSAKNITLNAASGGIGIDGEAQTISYDALNSEENLKLLANAKAGDLTWDEDNQQVTIRQQQAITVAADGAVNVAVEGNGNVYLAGVKDTTLDINDIETGGNVRLQGDDGVEVGSIKGGNLIIAGGEGSITSGNADDLYVHTELTGSLDAKAKGDIYISETGDLDILTLATDKAAHLAATGSILMENVKDSTAQGRINAAEVNLSAGGSIGGAGENQAIRILDNGAVVNAEAAGGIWISGESGDGSTGNLVIGDIEGGSFDLTSVSDVSLGRTDDPNTDEDESLTGSITTTNGDASISAVNVDLADGRVDTGEYTFNVTANGGNINQSDKSAGLTANHVNLSSTGSQLLRSENNNINSVTVRGLTDGSLTGNVEIHSAADNFDVQFGDMVGDTAAGITVNDGSIKIHHTGSEAGTLTVTGSATTQKSDGSGVNGDINFHSEQSAIDVEGTMNAGDNFSATTESGAIDITGKVTAHNGEVKATTNSGAISFNGDVTAMRGDVTAATGSGAVTFDGSISAEEGNINATTDQGNILVDGSAVAKTDILLDSGSGAITVNGIATAGNQFKADTVDGKITLGGDVTATAGTVNAHTTAGGIEVKGNVDAGTDIALDSGSGAITVTGSATADNNFSATTGSGDITLGGDVKAETGKVLAQTQSGTVLVNGSIQSALNTELQAGITADDTGNITVKGDIASGKEVLATAANGDIVFEGTTTASDGDVKAEVTGDGSITFNGAVTAVAEGEGGGNVVANVFGTGDITTESDAVFNAGKDVLFTTNVGNITANSAVTAGEDIVFKVLTEGNMTLRDDLKSEQNIDLNVNSGNILFEGTQDGVHEDIYVTSNGGDVTVSINEGGSGVIKDTNSEGPTGDWAHLTSAEGNVTVRHDGIGDVDLYELYAKQDAGVSVANGNLHLVNVSGNLVAVFVKSEGKDMDVENIEAAQQIAISGSNMDLDSITQREDGDGFLVITPEGTADDQPIDNLVIGDILTNGGVRFDHLWLNTGNIHVSEGALHLDKVYVQDKATFSTDDMTTNVFGSAPVYDDSVSSSYWVNTSINSPKDDLAAWNSDELNDKWMHIFFLPEGSVQISNGNLLHLADHNYAYNQRYSQVNWMNIFTDEDFYNFYDKYYAPDLSYHERYGLTSGSGHSVENAEEDEVIVE